MFVFFKKKEIDMQAAKAFWNWFTENEQWIINNFPQNGLDVIYAMDDRLTPVFPYFKKQLEFQYGYHDGKGEIEFFHLHNKYLIRDSEILKSMMPECLKARWTFTSHEIL